MHLICAEKTGRCPPSPEQLVISPGPKTTQRRELSTMSTMPVNVEIKAFARHPVRQKALTASLANGPAVVMDQCDTFFHVLRGRLKLRETIGKPATLIQYDRPNLYGIRTSRYRVIPIEDPDRVKQILGHILGISGEVHKRREFFQVPPARIHLDTVDGLGQFIEIEVVIEPGQSTQYGHETAHDLMSKLAITKSDLIAEAYIDLIISV